VSIQRDRFLEHVQRNPINCALLEQAAQLDVPDWWLASGAVFQTVWNVIDGRDPTAGIGDYDLIYFDDTDLSWDAEDAVIRRAAELFVDIPALVEVRNEARVHLWYEQHFGVPAEPFTSTTDAVDNFASTTCCFAVTQDSHGQLQVYAPHGYDDLFAQRVRPNPRLAPREVYERKAARWTKEWPGLIVDPWPHSRAQYPHWLAGIVWGSVAGEVSGGSARERQQFRQLDWEEASRGRRYGSRWPSETSA
jgi:hypothetical protein